MVPKLAFLLHIPDMYFHYQPVLRLLDPQVFDIILPDEAPEFLVDIVTSQAYRFTYISELLQAKTLYRWLVTDHVFLHDYRLMNQLGRFQIRMMSELGCDRLQLSHWNQLYDLILCFGRYQAKKLKFCQKTHLMQIGWPQYEPYYQTQDSEQEDLHQFFHCDPQRPTLVWLPYFEAISSIELYAERLAALTADFNVVVKPHDYTLLEELERVQLLERLPFTHVIRTPVDTLQLMRVADFIFADYGNTPFPALYCDKRLILLNVPYAPEHEYVGFGSSDVSLRSYLPFLRPESSLEEIYALLHDERPWERFERKRHLLRERFFAATYGNSAQWTAEILNQLEEIVP